MASVVDHHFLKQPIPSIILNYRPDVVIVKTLAVALAVAAPIQVVLI